MSYDGQPLGGYDAWKTQENDPGTGGASAKPAKHAKCVTCGITAESLVQHQLETGHTVTWRGVVQAPLTPETLKNFR